MQKSNIINPKLNKIIYFDHLASASIFFNKLLIKNNLADLCKVLRICYVL